MYDDRNGSRHTARFHPSTPRIASDSQPICHKSSPTVANPPPESVWERAGPTRVRSAAYIVGRFHILNLADGVSGIQPFLARRKFFFIFATAPGTSSVRPLPTRRHRHSQNLFRRPLLATRRRRPVAPTSSPTLFRPVASPPHPLHRLSLPDTRDAMLDATAATRPRHPQRTYTRCFHDASPRLAARSYGFPSRGDPSRHNPLAVKETGAIGFNHGSSTTRTPKR